MSFIQIKDLKDSRLELYTSYNENQLMHLYEPNGGVFIAETLMVIERALNLGCQPISFFVEEKTSFTKEFMELYSRCNDVDVFTAELDVINSMTGYNLTRGVLCAMRRPGDSDFNSEAQTFKRIAVLEQVQNPTNVGAIFRSAAALGVEGILLTYDCADPFYRRAARVSMGTVFQIPWAYIPKGMNTADFIHDLGFKIVSMALKDDAIEITSPCLKDEEKLAIVMGTEATGITDDTLDKSDYTVIIPMYNDVDSLNVAAASAVAFWELAGRK